MKENNFQRFFAFSSQLLGNSSARNPNLLILQVKEESILKLGVNFMGKNYFFSTATSRSDRFVQILKDKSIPTKIRTKMIEDRRVIF